MKKTEKRRVRIKWGSMMEGKHSVMCHALCVYIDTRSYMVHSLEVGKTGWGYKKKLKLITCKRSILRE